VDYLYKIRIEEAKQLLKETPYTIESIATKVGFLNSNAFIKAFKNNEGITPGAYRNLVKNSV
jgi:YesN/AraC family two-component response regulator